MEHDLHETAERMKRELEEVRGFSTMKAFKIMDKKENKYLDPESIWDWI